MKSEFKEKKTMIEAMGEIRDLFNRFLSKAAPAPNVTVHPPTVQIEAPTINVQPEKKTAWIFEVTKRDQAGLIKTFTAKPN